MLPPEDNTPFFSFFFFFLLQQWGLAAQPYTVLDFFFSLVSAGITVRCHYTRLCDQAPSSPAWSATWFCPCPARPSGTVRSGSGLCQCRERKPCHASAPLSMPRDQGLSHCRNEKPREAVLMPSSCTCARRPFVFQFLSPSFSPDPVVRP